MTFHFASARSKRVFSGSSLLAVLGAAWLLAACVGGQSAVTDDSVDPGAGGQGSGGDGSGTAGQIGTAGTGNGTAGITGTSGSGQGVAGDGSSGSGTSGSGSGTAGTGTGTAGAGTAGTGTGTAGAGTAGNGASGSGAGGSGTAGASGAGTAGAGTAGAGTAGAGTAGAGTAGGGGSGGTGPRQIYISPTGKDTNAGTQAAPLLTLTQAHGLAQTGSTIWVMDGTFNYTTTVKLTKSGTAALPMSITAVAGAHPIFDFSALAVASGNRGIEINSDYWHVKGIEVRKAGDNCIAITGSHNTIEQVVIHECADTGLQISANSSDAGNLSGATARAANNTVLNCDSYLNYDAPTKGENADGFAAKLYVGPGNLFQGCRSYNNADDGWDFIGAANVVTVDGCWSFLNGKLPSGDSNPAGDGNGFKLGGQPSGGLTTGEGNAAHVAKNSFGFENLACGFTRNNNAASPVLTADGTNKNGKGDYCASLKAPSSPVSMSMTGAQAKAAVRDSSGNLPPMK